MTKISVRAGTSISNAIEMALDLAGRRGETVEFDFNDISMAVQPGEDPADVAIRWTNMANARAEAYRVSPEGVKQAQEAQDRRRRMQDQHDALMRSLPDLNFGNDEAVLDWLTAFAEATDQRGVLAKHMTALEVFKSKGFIANENTGPHHRENDRQNVFRYLVGQAMDGMESGNICPVIHSFVADWKKKFAGLRAVL